MMEKDFLKGFRKRMQFVARYSVLCGNSIDRVVKWRSFGINTRDEQINMLFSVLLYIMEYSLKEEDCTKDMEKEGLDLEIQDGYLSAKQTSLGGDDGIAVAYSLALLASTDIPHPPAAYR